MATTITVTTPAAAQVLVTVTAAKDAYQLAVDAGFVGTREEWLATFTLPTGLSDITSLAITNGQLEIVKAGVIYYVPIFQQP